MERSETIGALASALALAQFEIGGAIKGNVNPAFKSKYADLASIWTAWQSVGPAQGLAIVQTPGAWASGAVSLTTTLVHKSGEYISEVLTIPLSKQDAQGYGSALTYARRYALAAFVGIAPEDDDANAAVQGSSKPIFADGPHKNKTALDTAMTGFCTHLAALGNSDDLESYITESTPTLAQYRAHYGRDSDHIAAITAQIGKARARVEAMSEREPDEGSPAVMTTTLSESMMTMLRQIDGCETKASLDKWFADQKPDLDKMSDDDKDLVRAGYKGRLESIRLMDTVTA